MITIVVAPYYNLKNMEKEKFKEGDVVYHIHNLQTSLIVDNIYIEKKEVIDKFDQDKNAFTKKEKNIIRGVGVHWWENKEFKTFRFHSRELIPERIVKQGQDEIDKYILSLSPIINIQSNK